MDEKVTKSIKRKTILFWITLVIGLLGVLEILTHGSVSYLILYIFTSFLPAIVAATIATVSETLLNLSIFWLVGAWSLHRSIKRLKEGKNGEFKSFKLFK
jgi:hypothetical protein